ncbi:hypothetical protein JHN46_44290, partial [Streptomyces sp. MBT33]|nr:hypothetical protein [Streptomyces sp. MBT33]
RQRAAVLLRFHDLVLERQAEVLDLIQLETGKARRAAWKAFSTSAGVDSGRSASFSPVNGVWLAVRPSPTPPTD